MYVHFTDYAGAIGIKQSMLLYSSSLINGVYAVSTDGTYVPSVQQTKLGRPKSRDIAVLFHTNDIPDKVYPEECIWYLEHVKITSILIVPAKNIANIFTNKIKEPE